MSFLVDIMTATHVCAHHAGRRRSACRETEARKPPPWQPLQWYGSRCLSVVTQLDLFPQSQRP